MGGSSDSRQLQQPDITSQTHPIIFLPIYLSVGTVYVTMPPGFRGMLYRKARGMAEIRRDLSADVTRLSDLGIHRLLTVMSVDGILQHGLGGLLTDLEGAGIDWTHIPFPYPGQDDETFPRYLGEEMVVIRSDVANGRKVAIHDAGWRRMFEPRLAKILSMLDPELSSEGARAIATATIKLGNAMSPM